MTNWLVTRHSGAHEWFLQQNIHIDNYVAHLETSEIKSGDRVYGILPIHLAEIICKRGGRYIHISLNVSPELRGKELNVKDMQQCQARLEEYRVIRFPQEEQLIINNIT